MHIVFLGYFQEKLNKGREKYFEIFYIKLRSCVV